MARRQGLTGSGWRYYHFDEIGSTRLLTDLDGMVTDSYAYDAWGNLIDRTGDTEQPYQYVGRLGYYTHYQAPAFNLLQLGVRFYDPEIGRFTQLDPTGDGLNWCAYVEDNPMISVDSSGSFCWKRGCTGTVPHRKCKSCIGWSCHGDPECPPAHPKPRPKPKPVTPPPMVTVPPSYILPPGAGEGVSLCDLDAACGAVAAAIAAAMTKLEQDYAAGKISEEEYNRRMAELERLMAGCRKHVYDMD